MALVNKRKLIILSICAIAVLILFSLFTNNSNSSNTKISTPEILGTVELEVTPTQALPLTVFDESGVNEITKLYSIPARFRYKVGKYAFILKSYDHEDFKIEADIIKDATVIKKVDMVSKNLPPDYSELGSTITTDNGVLIQNVQYYEYASWASGTLENGDKAVLYSTEYFWEILYSSATFNRDEMINARIPEVVINSLLGAEQ
ncbi:MAG: hypothetical protein Q7T41_01460 [Candidatus Saccharibacteria bacterium]|nr:hypothetical protein [Candidatus Saccharibacteria bacterium]